MTAGAASLNADVRVISLVGVAHGLSHFYHLAIPPLFPLLKDEFGVSYAALGSVMGVYFAVSGVLQTVAGFVVDRLGARQVLVGGLVLSALGIALAGLAPSFGWLYVTAVIAGLGNSVFHPADMALLNAKVAPARLGYAFSAHSIAGYLGWAVAPVFAAAVSGVWGWRGALIMAGAVGAVYVALMTPQRILAGGTRALRQHSGAPRGIGQDLQLLRSTPVMLCFGFFLALSMALSGWQTFSTTALTQLYPIELVFASSALTAFLLGSAAGVAFGGVLAARTERHRTVAVGGMLAAAAVTLALATGAVPVSLMIATIAAAGFAVGSVAPSRDILVREVAPVGARGKVYGFVYSGLDLGGLIAPLMVGWLLDRGMPDMVFIAAAALMVLSVPTVLGLRRSTAAQRAAAPGA